MSKTKTTSIQYVVKVGYCSYIFDTIERAARLVDLLAQGTKVSYDYHAPQREDGARTFYAEKVTVVAEIEAIHMIINDKQTPEAIEEPVEEPAEAEAA